MSNQPAPKNVRAPVLSLADRMKLMQACMFTPSIRNGNDLQWGLPMLAWGPPGVAKTSVARQVAKACKAPYFVFSPGEQGEGGIGQVPVPAPDGYLDCPAPRWSQPFTAKDGYGVVILDELTTADIRLQPGMLALALERSIGGRTLGGRVRVLAFANPVDQTPGGTDLALPLANRFIHIEWGVPELDEYLSYLSTCEAVDRTMSNLTLIDDPAAEERRVFALWPAAYADAIGAVSGFLHAMPTYLHKVPGIEEAAHGRAWPSPRSWDMAARSLAGARIHGLGVEARTALIAGCVGAGIGREFATYAKNLDLPPAMDVLTGKVKWDVEREKLDRSYAVLRAVTSLATSVDKTADSSIPIITGYWNFMAAAIAVRPDLVLSRVVAALQACIHAVNGKPMYYKAASPVIEALAAAGVLVK